MNNIFKIGDKEIHTFVVKQNDVAAFEGKTVHQVCATFVLAREIEWSSRLFVIKMKAEDEEGIGTQLTIKHKSPAFVDEEVVIEAEWLSFENNELICNYVAKVNNRLIATGITGQKIIKKDKIEKIFSTYR